MSNFGNFQWSHRWTYDGEETDMPLTARGYHESRRSAPKHTAQPSVPYRKKEVHYHTRSVYQDSFHDPPVAENKDGNKKKPAQEPVQRNQRKNKNSERQRGRMKAPKTTLNHHLSAHYHLDEEELKPEEKSFRLWGRHNPAHYVIPYETHSQRFYKDHGDQGALDKTHYLRVANKGYKEAIAKQTKVSKETKGGHYK